MEEDGKEKRVVVSSIIMLDPSSSSGCTIEVTVQPLAYVRREGGGGGGGGGSGINTGFFAREGKCSLA